MKAKVLVIGSKGLLGTPLTQILKDDGYEVTAKTGRAELDVTDLEQVRSAVRGFDFVINCSAYTAVDKAESEPIEALKTNSIGPKNLAVAIKETSGRLLHFSTDYTYGGVKERTPLKEGIQAAPVGIYGYTKFLGDEFIRSILPDRSAIFVTSWLHGENGPNFVATILRVAQEKPELKIVSDQIGSPTYATWLAESAVKFLSVFEPGLFHASNKGEISWFEFAKKIVELGGQSSVILPQTTAELGRPAPRPPYSALNTEKLEKLLGIPCQTWEEGLKQHLKNIR